MTTNKTINYEKSNLSLSLSLSNRLKSRFGSNTNPISHFPAPFAVQRTQTGFTIVELLVVIVVIGILAAITIVSYTGISQKAVASSLQSDLTNASQQLKLYQVDNDAFPVGLDCSASPALNTVCLKSSPGTTYAYFPVNNTNPKTFSLSASNGSTTYRISSSSTPTNCPDGFIAVPGSATYGTSDFCVMKYNAKADNGSGVGDTSQTTGSNTWPANTYPISASRKLVSTAAGYPVANISQTTAITAASSYVNNCTGCHLITEAEFLTIVQNVLNNPVNWSGGAVGSGFIYSGHNDNVPATALEASTDDSNGYYGTGNVSPSNQKRTLTLSNGEVIWDLAGNVYEWTTGTIAAGQQPGLTGEVAFAWKQWNNGLLLQNGLPASAMPGYTGISGASGWSSTQGIGQLYSNYGDASSRGFLRGGSWGHGSNAGVLNLILSGAPSTTGTTVGFRVSR